MVIINNNIVDTSSVSGAVTIPYGVTVIPTSAFAYKNITKVSIPNSVTEIKDAAFTECSNLSEVTMPDSVRSIGSSAFCNCTSLKEIE